MNDVFDFPWLLGFPLRRAYRASWPDFLDAGWNNVSFFTFDATADFAEVVGAMSREKVKSDREKSILF